MKLFMMTDEKYNVALFPVKYTAGEYDMFKKFQHVVPQIHNHLKNIFNYCLKNGYFSPE